MQVEGQTASVPLTFYCAWYCPFAQRAWMALLHKALPFDYIEVDPYRESRWWLAISRQRAMVPVIVATDRDTGGSTTVIDSTRVVEYLEDLVPDTHPLFPHDANDKAEMRFWIDQINERVVPPMYRYLAAHQPGEQRDEAHDALMTGMQELSGAVSHSGPYFAGPSLSAVDLALIPFACRIDALLGHYRDFSLPRTGEAWVRYSRWYATMRNTPIFQGTLGNPDDYRQRLIRHYLPYSQGKDHQADADNRSKP